MTIYEAIENVVASVNAEWSGDDVNFIYGSSKEVQKTLMEWSVNPSKRDSKYPCLILFTPFDQLKGEQGKNYEASMTVNMVLVTDTKKNYHTSERIVNIYTPILWPIYELFIEKLMLSTYFDFQNARVKHTYKDSFYYSPTDAKDQNVFSAILDAIEMNGMELNMYDLACKVIQDYRITEDGYVRITESSKLRITG